MDLPRQQLPRRGEENTVKKSELPRAQANYLGQYLEGLNDLQKARIIKATKRFYELLLEGNGGNLAFRLACKECDVNWRIQSHVRHNLFYYEHCWPILQERITKKPSLYK